MNVKNPEKMSGTTLNINTELIVLSSIGVVSTVLEGAYNSVTDHLDEIWKISIPEDWFGPSLESVAKTIMAIIVIARSVTLHVYVGSYILMMYPIFMKKSAALMVFWIFLAALRSIFLNLTSTFLGFLICAFCSSTRATCFEFAVVKGVELGCSVYLWLTVGGYYIKLRDYNSPRYHEEQSSGDPSYRSLEYPNPPPRDFIEWLSSQGINKYGRDRAELIKKILAMSKLELKDFHDRLRNMMSRTSMQTVGVDPREDPYPRIQEQVSANHSRMHDDEECFPIKNKHKMPSSVNVQIKSFDVDRTQYIQGKNVEYTNSQDALSNQKKIHRTRSGMYDDDSPKQGRSKPPKYVCKEKRSDLVPQSPTHSIKMADDKQTTETINQRQMDGSFISVQVTVMPCGGPNEICIPQEQQGSTSNPYSVPGDVNRPQICQCAMKPLGKEKSAIPAIQSAQANKLPSVTMSRLSEHPLPSKLIKQLDETTEAATHEPSKTRESYGTLNPLARQGKLEQIKSEESVTYDAEKTAEKRFPSDSYQPPKPNASTHSQHTTNKLSTMKLKGESMETKHSALNFTDELAHKDLKQRKRSQSEPGMSHSARSSRRLQYEDIIDTRGSRSQKPNIVSLEEWEQVCEDFKKRISEQKEEGENILKGSSPQSIDRNKRMHKRRQNRADPDIRENDKSKEINNIQPNKSSYQSAMSMQKNHSDDLDTIFKSERNVSLSSPPRLPVIPTKITQKKGTMTDEEWLRVYQEFLHGSYERPADQLANASDLYFEDLYPVESYEKQLLEDMNKRNDKNDKDKSSGGKSKSYTAAHALTKFDKRLKTTTSQSSYCDLQFLTDLLLSEKDDDDGKAFAQWAPIYLDLLSNKPDTYSDDTSSLSTTKSSTKLCLPESSSQMAKDKWLSRYSQLLKENDINSDIQKEMEEETGLRMSTESLATTLDMVTSVGSSSATSYQELDNARSLSVLESSSSSHVLDQKELEKKIYSDSMNELLTIASLESLLDNETDSVSVDDCESR
ncbi:uncharacterized protein LOC106673864 isoform X2 [Cimex lectularius]|uniref:Uncharacterized protein n=1 Tax=Cimex lectularius TaxID=79782 RepID=A0A8I6SSA4_CIMLE|nr:uncharacterized protein LOC106673864 isoform X2 [Cimex lectularius]